MNHKTTETRNRQSGSHATTPKQLLQSIKNGNNLSTDDSTKIANCLLASILAYYKETTTNTFTVPLPFNFKGILDLYNEKKSSQFTQFISTDGLALERQSANIALTPVSALGSLSCIDVVFYSIVNLTRPESTFAASIEFNASSALNVIIASVVEGAQTQDLERLLILCMFLKDTESCYPLRSFAISACLETISENSIPYFARTTLLKLILGPAEFILHHLESRILLSTSISNLLQYDLCEDIEFRAVLLRIVRKIGLAKPMSQHEQQKIRLYHYLELLIASPAHYSCKESITSYMTVAQWSSVLNRDFVLYLYLTENKYQVLGFLEALKIIGVKFVLFSPCTIQHLVIGGNEYNQEVTLCLNSIHCKIYSLLDNIADARNKNPDQYEYSMEAPGQIVLENTIPNSAIQSRLVEAQDLVCHSVLHSNNKTFLSNLEQLLNFSTQILRSSSIVPSRFLPWILWMTAVNLKAFNKIRLEKPEYEVKICEGVAVCLDVYLSCIGRNENELQSNSTSSIEFTSANNVSQYRHSEGDLSTFFSSFMLLFPVDDILTWCCRASTDLPGGAPKPSICAIYLFRIFEQLVPHLESLVKMEKVTPDLIFVRLFLLFISIQIPFTILAQEYLEFKNTLNNIADLQGDSTLSKSPVWQELFVMSYSPHPLHELETRLRTILTTANIIENK